MTKPTLQGRVALVTGGGSGIGAASARALAAAGARTVLTSRTRAQLDETAATIASAGGTADVLPWDITGESASSLVSETLNRAGRLDILVHAAGNQIRKPMLEFTLDDWDAVMDVHLRAAFTLTQAALPTMIDQSAGAVIYVGSMTSQRLGHPSTVAYAAAKSGVLGLARTLAVEFATSGVRVNTVLPGFIRDGIGDDIVDTPQRRALTDRIPQNRYGTPGEVGETVAFLASDAARYITGETINVDGGWSVA